MLNDTEANSLINTFLDLRAKYAETQALQDKIAFEKHQKICIQKFRYLIDIRASRYKAFSNYDDLVQEGLEGLVMAMRNYNPAKGSFFWWAHKYVDTRIARSANLHTTIRYPLKIAKELIPHKEAIMPMLVDSSHPPDREIEQQEIEKIVNFGLNSLTEEQQNILILFYGLNGDKPKSLAKICEELNITRAVGSKLIEDSLVQLKKQIKL